MDTHTYYPLPRETVAALRSADVLDGEFRRGSPSPDAVEALRGLGLVKECLSGLNDTGMEVRRMMMIGAEGAVAAVAALTRPQNWGAAA